jgi:hypothetical protein
MNGTQIGSVRIDRAVVVRNGDTLRFGSVLVRARLNPPVDSTVTGA